MGHDLKFDNQEIREYLEAIDNIGNIAFYRFIRPILHNNFIFYNFTAKGRVEKKITNSVSKFMTKIIKQREANFENNEDIFSIEGNDCESKLFSKRKLAMLDILIESKKLGNINYKGIQDEVNTFMFGVM